MPISRRWSLLNVSFLLGTLGLALVLVPLTFAHSLRHWGEWVVFLSMVGAIGMSVTCGYHRLFSHRAYQARWPVRLAMLCLGAASFENSALHWASDHRIHHQARGPGRRSVQQPQGLLVRPLGLGHGGAHPAHHRRGRPGEGSRWCAGSTATTSSSAPWSSLLPPLLVGILTRDIAGQPDHRRAAADRRDPPHHLLHQQRRPLLRHPALHRRQFRPGTTPSWRPSPTARATTTTTTCGSGTTATA